MSAWSRNTSKSGLLYLYQSVKTTAGFLSSECEGEALFYNARSCWELLEIIVFCSDGAQRFLCCFRCCCCIIHSCVILPALSPNLQHKQSNGREYTGQVSSQTLNKNVFFCYDSVLSRLTLSRGCKVLI